MALSSPKEVVDKIRDVYQHRISILYKALKDLGLPQLEKPRATLYLSGPLWEEAPSNMQGGFWRRLA